MDICMVAWTNLPPDIRIKREAKFLVNQGHSVTVICNKESDQAATEEIDGINVIRFKKKNDSLVRQALFHLTLSDPAWYLFLKKHFRNNSYDLLHVHDLPPIRTVLKACPTVPIVLDLHELYPEALLRIRDSMNPVQKLLRPISRYRKLENNGLQKADGVITVSPPQKRHYLSEYNISDDKITVVRNVPDLDRLRNISPSSERNSTPFQVAYAGNFTSQRDLNTVIKSVAKVRQKGFDVELCLMGSGPNKIESELHELTHRLDIGEHVDFTGWIDLNQMFENLQESNLGVCPWVGNNIDSQCTLPNKIFQYMYMELPVVATNLDAMRDLIEETECGIAVPASDTEAMTDAIVSLVGDSERARQLGENGRKAVVDRYNFTQEGKNIRRMYEQVLSSHYE